jgi:hypothetical protein
MRDVSIVAVVGVALASVIGVAGADPTTSTTDVAITPLTVGHKVLSNASIAAHQSKAVVVIGGATTVPSNATTVRLTISAKGAAGGMVGIYPTGNPGAASLVGLPYQPGNQLNTLVFQQNVGQSNEITFSNDSSGAAVVTVTLTGYSTQVTAGDIGGTEGLVGQVLTYNGAGGASWQDAGDHAYEVHTASAAMANTVFTNIASTTVPAGTYFVSWSGVLDNTDGAGFTHRVDCELLGPGFYVIATTGGDIDGFQSASMSMQGLLHTGGDIVLQCRTVQFAHYRVSTGNLDIVHVR